MPRRGHRDWAKEKYWYKIFADWELSALSAAEYCRRNGIKYHQFIDWQKRRRKQAAELERRTQQERRELQQRAAERKKQEAAKAKSSRTVEAEHNLVQVTITDDSRAQVGQGNGPSLEIVLQCGTIIRVNADCSTGLLSTVLSVLEDR